MNNHYIKDINATLDFKWDWTNWLVEGETITDYIVTISSGLTLVDTSKTDGTVIAWLSGGEDAKVYILTCNITTNMRRSDGRSMIIQCVKER